MTRQDLRTAINDMKIFIIVSAFFVISLLAVVFLRNRKIKPAGIVARKSRKLPVSEWKRRFSTAINQGVIVADFSSVKSGSIEEGLDDITNEFLNQYGTVKIAEGGTTIGRDCLSMDFPQKSSDVFQIGVSEEDWFRFLVKRESPEVYSCKMEQNNFVSMDVFDNVYELALVVAGVDDNSIYQEK